MRGGYFIIDIAFRNALPEIQQTSAVGWSAGMGSGVYFAKYLIVRDDYTYILVDTAGRVVWAPEMELR